MDILNCKNPQCIWWGDEGELVTRTQDVNDQERKFCPKCGGSDFTVESAA